MQHKTKAQSPQRTVEPCIAVYARCGTNRVAEPNSKYLPFERGMAVAIDAREEPFAEARTTNRAEQAERKIPHPLGREQKEYGAYYATVKGHIPNSKCKIQNSKLIESISTTKVSKHFDSCYGGQFFPYLFA